MSSSQPAQLSAPRAAGAGAHRLSMSGRGAAAAWIGTPVLAFVVAVAMPHPNYALVLAAVAGVVGVVVLVSGRRLEVKVAMLALWLGLLDGPVKLLAGSGGELTSGLRDVLIVAACVGPVLGMVLRREPLRLPPLSGWVVAYIALVLVEAFNPHTSSVLNVFAGYRQLLEWVPFFFFGYALMRSKRRLRKFFLVLGVIALANGLMATYQTLLSPGQVASWGPGYHTKIYPKHGGGRTYFSEGESHVRPLGLGSDSGFGGGVGLVALPCMLALLATWRGRKKWLIVLLNIGALLAIVTSLGRLQVAGAVIVVLAFTLLSSLAGHRGGRAVRTLLGVVVVAVPVGVLLVSALHPGTFSRYEKLGGGSTTSYKETAWTNIPHQVSLLPFGVGLGTTGPVGGFGGPTETKEVLEGHGVNAETQYNFLADELGAPGILLWAGLALTVIALAIRRIGTIGDPDLRIALAGVISPMIALVLMGFSGPLSTSAALGPYYWFAAGVAAFWLAPPARRAAVAGAQRVGGALGVGRERAPA